MQANADWGAFRAACGFEPGAFISEAVCNCGDAHHLHIASSNAAEAEAASEPPEPTRPAPPRSRATSKSPLSSVVPADSVPADSASQEHAPEQSHAEVPTATSNGGNDTRSCVPSGQEPVIAMGPPTGAGAPAEPAAGIQQDSAGAAAAEDAQRASTSAHEQTPPPQLLGPLGPSHLALWLPQRCNSLLWQNQQLAGGPVSVCFALKDVESPTVPARLMRALYPGRVPLEVGLLTADGQRWPVTFHHDRAKAKTASRLISAEL